jgi:hypothetical protein
MFRKYGVVGLFVTMELKGKKIKTIDEALKELTEKDKEDIIKIQRGILEDYGIDVNKENIKKQKEKTKVAISDVKTCSFFNINRSSYYYEKVINVIKNAQYETKKKLVYSTFVNTGECMGANKLTKIIKRNSNIKISNNSVQFFMNLLHLKPHAYAKKRRDPKNTNRGFNNVIKRKFKSLSPNEMYTTDITYIHSNFAEDGFFI